jgi:hypothetical protein
MRWMVELEDQPTVNPGGLLPRLPEIFSAQASSLTVG